MIFVTIGTQKFQLNRLLKKMDQLCAEGKIKEEVFAQIGQSDYRPKNYNFITFMDEKTFEEKIKQSSLVITHSGVGSIMTALKYRKPVIIFPRLYKYKEHVDNHQLEIAEVFAKKNYVLCCNEEDDLYSLIYEAKTHSFNTYNSSQGKIIDLVRKFLEEL